jgi:hypothetical protein
MALRDGTGGVKHDGRAEGWECKCELWAVGFVLACGIRGVSCGEGGCGEGRESVYKEGDEGRKEESIKFTISARSTLYTHCFNFYLVFVTNSLLDTTKMYFTALTLAALAALSTALPATISERYPSGLNITRPYQIYTYNDMNISLTTQGEVSRDFPNGHEVSTLVTFELDPDKPLPKTCFLRFSVEPNTLSSTSSRNTIDVFSSLQPVLANSAFVGGNQRNLPLGRLAIDLNAVGDERVKVVDPPSALSAGFPCPKAGDSNVVTVRKDGRDFLYFGYEIVFAGQEGRLTWNGLVNGLYLTYQR